MIPVPQLGIFASFRLAEILELVMGMRSDCDGHGAVADAFQSSPPRFGFDKKVRLPAPRERPPRPPVFLLDSLGGGVKLSKRLVCSGCL